MSDELPSALFSVEPLDDDLPQLLINEEFDCDIIEEKPLIQRLNFRLFFSVFLVFLGIVLVGVGVFLLQEQEVSETNDEVIPGTLTLPFQDTIESYTQVDCCLYQDQCISDPWCNQSEQHCLGPCNQNHDKKWGPPGGHTTPKPGPPGPSNGKCGYAVSQGAGYCEKAAQQVGEKMSCFAYGGPSDPCSLNCNNDAQQGMNKDPSLCMGPEFFLWDEPDTQGFSYSWAGSTWMQYSQKYASQLAQLRARGTQIIAPAVKNDKPGVNIDAFMNACPSCLTPGSPSKIDGFASNVFVGSWNHGDLNGGVTWSVNQFKPTSAKYNNMPFYVTNWSYLGTHSPYDQKAAMSATRSFFINSSPVVKVFYFAARDYGGGTTNNGFDSYAGSQSLGEIWRQTCDSS